MTEIYEHNPGDHEDPVPGPTWIIGFLGAVLMVVIMLGITALYYRERSEEDTKKIVLRDPMELVNLREAQEERLKAGAHWETGETVEEVKVDGQAMRKTTVSKALVIPVEQAVQAVIAEAGAGKPVAIGGAETVSSTTEPMKPATPAAEPATTGQ